MAPGQVRADAVCRFLKLLFAGSSRFLAPVEALVRGFEKFGSRKAVGRLDGKAHADRERGRAGLQAEKTADALGDIFRAFRVGSASDILRPVNGTASQPTHTLTSGFVNG
jgi:hypothetical protein